MLARVTPVYQYVNAVQAALIEALIGFKNQRVHASGRVREHAILGDDGITLDAAAMRG